MVVSVPRVPGGGGKHRDNEETIIIMREQTMFAVGNDILRTSPGPKIKHHS